MKSNNFVQHSQVNQMTVDPTYQRPSEMADVKFLSTIDNFFNYSTPQQHLKLLAHWRHLISGDQFYCKDNSPADLLYKHRHLLDLYEAAYTVCLTPGPHLGRVTGDHMPYIMEEAGTLDYYPDFDTASLANPIIVVRQLFSTHDITYYREQLFDWLVEGLSPNETADKTASASFYKDTTKLIGACWLIREREINTKYWSAVASSRKPNLDTAVEFYMAALFFLESGAYSLIPFMLKQACNLTYRTLLAIMEADEAACCSLCNLRTAIKRRAPGLIGVFSENEADELRLLGLLDTACIDNCYAASYKKEELILLSLKMGELQQRSAQLFNAHSSQQKVATQAAMPAF